MLWNLYDYDTLFNRGDVYFHKVLFKEDIFIFITERKMRGKCLIIKKWWYFSEENLNAKAWLNDAWFIVVGDCFLNECLIMAIKSQCNTPCELIFFNVNVYIEHLRKKKLNSTSPVQHVILQKQHQARRCSCFWRSIER